MGKLVRIAVVLPLFCMGALPAGAPALDGKVSSVTVFTSGSAQVVRTGRVSLQPGQWVLRSSPLPAAVDAQSVQISFKGALPGLAIESVETRKELPDETEFQGKQAEFMRALRAEQDALFGIQQDAKAADDAIQSRKETLAFLEKMRTQSAQAVDRELASASFKLEPWREILDAVELRAEKARKEIREMEATRRKIQSRLEEEKAKYAELAKKSPAQAHQMRLYVTVAAQSADSPEYRIVYNVSRAWWEPSYRASANMKDKTVTLDVFGSVRQSTGEDWEDVRLNLSTARPDIGTDVPVLLPWYLRTGLEPPKLSSAIGERKIGEPETGVSAEADIPVDGTEGPPADAVSAGTSTVFSARASARIPSDGQFHKIPVTTLHSPATFEHVAIPKILPHAFLQAKMANKAAFPILPGVVEVVVGESYVGRGMMKLAASGEAIRLSLGVDEDIRISINLVENKGERKRRNDRVATTNVFDIQATNFGDETVNLTILDQIPISRSGDVTVTCGAEAKKALRGATFPGQLKWETALAPKKPVEIEFDFTIEYPESMRQSLEMNNRDNALEYRFDYVQQEAMPQDENAPKATAPSYRFENRSKTNQAQQKLKF